MGASENPRIVTVNAGSSSIKLGLFTVQTTPQMLARVSIENIGQTSARRVLRQVGQKRDDIMPVAAPNADAAAQLLVDWLLEQVQPEDIVAVGHRVVHGGPNYHLPTIVNETVLAALRQVTLFDPNHLPLEIELIEGFQKLLPTVPQVACFDTDFHHNLPLVAKLLPIPRRYEALGVHRYGFHGLSCQYVLKMLEKTKGPQAAQGRLIIAHLGSGVSLTAVHRGQSIETTMGLTPASGVPMSTRAGDLDPGLSVYLARGEGLDAAAFEHMINFESGLLGLSETTADMEQLLAAEAKDKRAKVAIDLFCYQIKKSIGSLSAALGGLDTLVFTGGMGERAPKVRARICQDLEYLGIRINSIANKNNKSNISKARSSVRVHVMHTNEAAMIAQKAYDVTQK